MTDPARRVLIAANRLPVTIKLDGGAVSLTRSSGGLANAMRYVHDGGSSLWFGFAGEPARAKETERAQIREALREQRLVPVELTAAEVSRYYDGFSNGVLWPLCHYLIERVKRDASLDWNSYRIVNERFAAAIAAEWRPGDLVWVHDYHLFLVPGLLRRRIPDATIGFFLHIPFPSGEVFRILPWREQLLRGLLSADVVGFHTADYAHHFRYAATRLVGAEDLGDELAFEDRRVRAGAYPIGIDVASFAELAGTPEVQALTDKWRRSWQDRRIVLGVDRLDYTKGIVRRLLAMERLFERWPTWRERLQLVQLAVPTREKADEYATFRREVEGLVGRINGRFGTPGWAPILFLHRSVSPTELTALYRAADVMLVTPLRDGMNLVAKEYCAARVDDHGVLVLSELAGAAAELREAILVNPYDLDASAAAVRRALEMPDVEQAVRMTALRATITAGDVHHWAGRFLHDLEATPRAPLHGPVGVDGHSSELTAELAAVRSAARRLLLLDYDGTLVPFAPMPELAFPDDDLRALLTGLGGDPANDVHIVSGRSQASIDAWLADLPLGLHAEHGFWSRWQGEGWTALHTADPAALAPIDAIMADVVRRTPGSFVERKGASLAWHYRMAEPMLAARRLDELRHRLGAELPAHLELLDGNKVLEVRVRGADKRAAARRILEARAKDGMPIVAIGDDRTDEDLFAALPASATTIRVGPGATRARHRVDGVDEVRALLRALS